MKIFSKEYNAEKEQNIYTILGIKIKLRKRNEKNIYVGCGDDYIDGYIGCDIRKTPNVKYVCKAWEISSHVKNVENIYSRHMCEHLTYQEFEITLKDWYKALIKGGNIHIIVPNIDYHVKQFQRAVFNNENLKNEKSDLAWSIAGFCGWQREDYINKNSKTKYWDVHKSIWNEKLMKLYLENVGFNNIKTEIINNVHLSVKAKK